MKYIIFILNIIFLTSCQSGSENITRVFVSGTEGYKIFRIPAIVMLPDGQLLAFAEGRVNGSNDFGDIDIVLRKSNDGGRKWTPLTVIADYDSLQAGNPAPVVDLLDPAYPGGRIFLFYNTGNNNETEVRKGNGLREVWYRTSTDGGDTWSAPVNITPMVHRPFRPDLNPGYNFSEDWRSYANTPGHAMQFMSGIYRGRILVAANHSEGEPSEKWEDNFSHDFFTDDHGQTFRLGGIVRLPGSNEATAAQISGNGLILNARNQKGDIKARITALSMDGGETFDTVLFDNNLPDPVCEGSILDIGEKGGKFILAFSNAADTERRNNLTLRISFDEGRTWPRSINVDRSAPGQKNNDYTAYSDIVNISSGDIGILYERNSYSEIVFRVIKWK